MRYALLPDYPQFADGDAHRLPDLHAPVEVVRRPDGLWKISADDEHDALLAEGYLQARDRLAQLDIFRHVARGELAALIGNRPFGERSALDADRMNRFLGFRDQARLLYERTSAEERLALQAFVRGINAWIAEGHPSLEHRLLGVDKVQPWTPYDSLSIYLMVMHSLGSNWDREIRRLVIACASGLDAAERVWPQDIEADVYALPDEDLRAEHYPPQPAVPPELAEALDTLCAQGAAEASPAGESAAAAPPGDMLAMAGLGTLTDLFRDGWSASNNWVVAGGYTASGKPILSSDPHLPQLNPPMAWGVDIEFPGSRTAGFTLPGLHRVVFGHNGHVAWGATTNHVDRQDLVVHRGRTKMERGETEDGYELEGEFVPFEHRTEVFDVKGGSPVRVTVRFTRDGPLLNDLDPFLAGRIPLTALRLAPLGRGTDLDGARAINRARNGEEFAAGISLLDLGCSNWVFADAGGNIGYRSPCLVPIRPGWRGTFPVPGWLRRYDWQGFVPKNDLPASTDPARGWLATANNQIVPSNRFPTAYNTDTADPNRFLRISARLRKEMRKGGLTARRDPPRSSSTRSTSAGRSCGGLSARISVRIVTGTRRRSAVRAACSAPGTAR